MRVSSRPLNIPVAQPPAAAERPDAASSAAAAPAAAHAGRAPADTYAGQEPSLLAKVGAFTKGALAGAVASPFAVAVLGSFALAAVGVTPFGAAGVAAMATMKSCMVGAAWVGGAVNGLAELEDLKSAAKPAATQDA